jgi:hypothetical protein
MSIKSIFSLEYVCNKTYLLVVASISIGATNVANATTFPNISGPGPDLPNGEVSFADAVTSFEPGIVYDEDEMADVPFPAFLGAENTLGIPDVTAQTAVQCFLDQNQENCNFASLGVGGTLTVEFVDNRLTGSGDTADDLWIYEIGPDIEDTFVEISMDGNTWFDVGVVSGSTKGVDIDAFGFGPTDMFRFVRLTDDPDEGNIDGETVGADIDAIAAISTAVIPIPAAVWLFGSGLIGLIGLARRKKS